MAKRRGKTANKSSSARPVQPAARRAHIAITQRDRLAGEWFTKLVALQARLRGPNGCPWDHEQTHESLRKYLIEEAYEVLDAMESGEPRKFASELGDLLLQVIFHSILAEEERHFTISDVIESVHTKMIRRHPHVFGDVAAKTPAAVLKNWEEIKRQERADENAGKSEGVSAADSILMGVARSLPAVLEAYQLTRRASRAGFDWDDLEGIFDKLDEERREIESIPSEVGAAKNGKKSALRGRAAHRLEEEVGDLLFVCVNVARFLDVDPEIALKTANAKFRKRFQWMESAARSEGRLFEDLPRDDKEALWNHSKTEAK